MGRRITAAELARGRASAVERLSAATRRRAAEAKQKRAEGKKLTGHDQAAIERLERATLADVLWQRCYQAIPKGDYVRLSGRPHKVVDEQGQRYGLPVLGDTIDLGELLGWLHDFLAEHKYVLGSSIDDPLLAGASQALKDEYVRQQIAEKAQRTRLAELEVQEREGALIVRDVVHDFLAEVAGIVRRVAEAIQKHYGPEAHDIVAEGIDDINRRADLLTSGYLDRERPADAGDV